ncbi:hypothetical protein H6G00_01825 [Leptolyngbya sp. FACHB-541]|uniref:hypothetical protein n=1 Tax=Leptolyngbya sp. FACHB-541 TaxID=2692810 RepID=UPI0016852DCE|nr:hypothetical protein [Leptolyngbya sp. FACHB-541]MBD1995370.1 hypothetical protein [Leptolyngbya sp. FACHB-541]
MSNIEQFTDSSEQVFQSILLLAADSPEALRSVDVDRVMEAAEEQDCLTDFRNWLLSFKLKEHTKANIDNWVS